ncbi:MAG: XRE family transcriptional regulator [Catenulispora sp.]|nr:XRE family transcriptional regulator [Catenulispora sp.]
MQVVDRWTGRRASALRASLRMTNEAFATRLGAAVRTVAYWEAKPDTVPSPALQEVLDRALADADDVVQRRFALLLAAAEEPGVAGVGVRRPAESAVMASQEEWNRVRRYLIESGIGLATRTASLYDDQLRVDDVPAIAPAGWIPAGPVRLEDVALHWIPDLPSPRITGHEAEARPTLPLRARGHAFSQYSSAIRYLRPPALFENRHSYRLTGLSWSGGRGDLTFGLSTFFDKLDVSEPLGHEAAQAELAGRLDWSHLPFRSLIEDPFDLAVRAVNPGISTLTLRLDREAGTGTFFLLQRDPTQVTNGRHYSLLPAGEFQPASIAAESVVADLDIWRNMVREFSEELLGHPEHDGSSGVPVDYEVWPFFRAMSAARVAGTIRAYVLGVALDALSLNASIATVAVIDASTFDQLFRDLVSRNPEGEVVRSLDGTKSIHGLPFDQATVQRLLTRERLGQTSAACLTLAWRHRHQLLDGPSPRRGR